MNYFTNAAKNCLVLVFCVNLINFTSANVVRPFRNTDICGKYNNHRVYLELHEKGILKAENVTHFRTSYPPSRAAETDSRIARQCSLELVTCPSCQIRISLSQSNITSNCVDEHDDHILIFESPYDPTLSGTRICATNSSFVTTTRTVTIRFVFQRNYTHAFTLEYYAEKNTQTFFAEPSDTLTAAESNQTIITSPFFPALYPRDYTVEYNFTCLTPSCRIHIIFSDFLISTASSLELYDSNGDQIEVITGIVARPRPIISTNSTLLLRFYANGGTGLGYRAAVKFINEDLLNETALHPITDCGGLVDTFGGAITMMKMLQNETEPKLYDCIWLIRPPNTYMHLKTHLMLKVDAFEKMAGPSELVIRQGLTSDKPEIEGILFPARNLNESNVVVPLSTGFYVHLRGVFGIDSRLAIIYTVFSYMNCFLGSEFLCENHRCIPVQLHCDGFDHCGDRSDEPDSCDVEWAAEPIDRRWYVHTPNYWFPKIDRYPDLKTATMIFIMSTMGLLTLISCLIVLLYKTGARAREQRELQSQLQTISELLDNNNIRGDEPIDEPPTYEAPPEYDEVIKLGLEEEIQRNSHGRRSGRKSRLQINRATLRNSTSSSIEIVNNIQQNSSDAHPSSSSPSNSEMERCQHISRLREELEGNDFFAATSRIDVTNTINRPSTSQTTEAPSTTQQQQVQANNWSPPPMYVAGIQGTLFNAANNIATTGNENESSPVNPNVSISVSMSRQESIDSSTWIDSSTTQQHCFIIQKTDSKTTFSKTSSIDSVDLAHVKEIGAYLLRYDSLPETLLHSTNTSSSTLSSSTPPRISSTEVFHQCIHSTSDQDKEKFFHQNCTSVPGFFFCVNCGGNFAFQYINSSGSLGALPNPMQSQNVGNASISAPNVNSNQKLCNCVLNQSFSQQIPEQNIPKSQSADQLMTVRHENEEMETAKSETGISGEEESTERCESGV
ncbi:uncharacterized protein LOC134830827 [Culicoides brevitarsis]|uniref:uncharacterized protein LOC134830827 n=1 Tax=Culicoides brevitarsis TaxID=469753 RepID=UPI00307C2699